MITCRWGGTPLDDSMRSGHADVTAYLRSIGASQGVKYVPDESELLCNAAARGDVTQLRRLVADGVDINKGDYDKRTALCAAPTPSPHANILAVTACAQYC